MKTKPTSGNQAAPVKSQLHFDYLSNPPESIEPWRSKKEVAAHYGMCTRTIERAVAEQLDPMPHRRCRGRILFQFSAIDHWLTITEKYRVATRGGIRKPTPSLPSQNVPGKLLPAADCPSSKSAASSRKVPSALPAAPDALNISPSEPRVVRVPVLNGPQIIGQASPACSPQASTSDTGPRKCRHRFVTSLYTRTCSKCGLTQHKDPATGNWEPTG
jgi:hypothetical protein